MKKKRLDDKELQHIFKLVEEGKSLNKISYLTGRNKTTIYYHFLKIRGKTFEPIQLRSNDEELIGEFIGLFAGDGCVYVTNEYQYKTYLHFNITEKEFVEDLIDNVLIELFGKKPMIFVQENRLNLCYYSKNIHKFIKQYLIWNKDSRKTYSVRLKNKNHSKKFAIGFIRGSLDSDGHYSRKKINFASVSPGLIKNISNFLNELNIAHSVRLYKEKRENRKDIYHINVLRSEHNRFVKMISPRNVIKYRD